jgi:hypothetical protein
VKELLEHLPSLLPIDFFALSLSLPEGMRSVLPSTAALLAEKALAEVSLTWKESGLRVDVESSLPMTQSCYPHYFKGDALELFIDTRDCKDVGVPTKFCHHLLILPEEVQGVRCLELTRLRAEDARPRCDGAAVDVHAVLTRTGYRLRVEIPAACLHGYDPSSFDRLGFSYRLRWASGELQHFSVSSNLYAIEQHPSFWASIELARE